MTRPPIPPTCLPALVLALVTSAATPMPVSAAPAAAAGPPPCATLATARRAAPGATQWTPGAPLPAGVERKVIRDPGRFGLPRLAEGTQYVRVDTDILRIAVDTAQVIEVVAKVARITH